MTRSRASAKSAGTRFETAIVAYLAEHVDERIERRARNGAKDRGDVSGVRAFRGGRVVVEAKDYGGRFLIGPWLREADIERGNDDAIAGVVVAKRRGTTDPAEQVVILTLADLVAILTGERPPEIAIAGPEMPRVATNGPTAHYSASEQFQSVSGPLSPFAPTTKET